MYVCMYMYVQYVRGSRILNRAMSQLFEREKRKKKKEKKKADC